MNNSIHQIHSSRKHYIVSVRLFNILLNFNLADVKDFREFYRPEYFLPLSMMAEMGEYEP